MASINSLKYFMTDENHIRNRTEQSELCKTMGWEYWIEDNPVVPELAAMYSQLPATVKRNIKMFPVQSKGVTGVRDGGALQPMYVARELSVFVGDCPFDVCKVGFGNYNVNKDEPMFMVYSRKIKNQKYRAHREQFNMIMSKGADKAATNLQTYLIPLSHVELARVYYREIHTNIANEANRICDVYQSKAMQVMHMDWETVGDELYNLAKQNVSFKSAAFQEAVQNIAEAKEAYYEEKGRQIVAVFVRFRGVGDEQFVEVIEGNARVSASNYAVPNQTWNTYHSSDLPQDIAERVAVLSILEDMQYVPKVGQKIDSTSFWIERG